MQKRVSVIIPTYNLKDKVLLCIKSVYAQTYKNIELILVDNASTDGTSQAISEQFPKTIVIRNEENLFVTGAVNKGYKKATGEYILLVDHDNILKEDLIEQLVNLIESDEEIGITVGKIYYDEDKTLIWAAGTSINLFTGQIFFRTGRDIGQYEKVEEVQVAPANFLVRREVLEKDRVYDPVYILSYEDTDLSFRARKAGYKVMYTPKAISYHMIPVNDIDSSKRLLSRAYWVGRNRVIFMRKWGHFYIFLIFLVGLSLFYFYLSLKYKDLKNFINYLKGIKEGLSL